MTTDTCEFAPYGQPHFFITTKAIELLCAYCGRWKPEIEAPDVR
jgi:hypothetical protein